jgi:hypothetical protein
VVLDRKSPGSWIVNKQFKAQQSQVETLLETINQVQVKNPVPLSARDNVIKTLAAESVRIRIFKKDEPVKTYFVGGTTPDELGTLMLLENAREPFVTYIPGFDGYLNSRYITREQDWRSTEIYHLNPSEISQVTVTYPQNPESSFKLSASDGNYMLSPAQNGQAVRMNEIEAKRYLSGFRGIDFEEFVPLDARRFDSLIHSTPFAVVELTAKGQKSPRLTIFSRTMNERSKSADDLNTDHERYYAILEGSHDVVLLQYFVVSKILASRQQLAVAH